MMLVFINYVGLSGNPQYWCLGLCTRVHVDKGAIFLES